MHRETEAKFSEGNEHFSAPGRASFRSPYVNHLRGVPHWRHRGSGNRIRVDVLETRTPGSMCDTHPSQNRRRVGHPILWQFEVKRRTGHPPECGSCGVGGRKGEWGFEVRTIRL